MKLLLSGVLGVASVVSVSCDQAVTSPPTNIPADVFRSVCDLVRTDPIGRETLLLPEHTSRLARTGFDGFLRGATDRDIAESTRLSNDVDARYLAVRIPIPRESDDCRWARAPGGAVGPPRWAPLVGTNEVLSRHLLVELSVPFSINFGDAPRGPGLFVRVSRGGSAGACDDCVIGWYWLSLSRSRRGWYVSGVRKLRIYDA